MIPEYLTFSDHVNEDLERLISNKIYSRIAILVDENTEKYCLPSLDKLSDLQPIIIRIKSGEEHKNLQSCSMIWSKMIDAGLDRKSVLINLGGGVICDIGGFCAATFKRGISFINLPTTLLAMADASIGGKTGFDLLNLKNQIGLFKNPDHVLIHPGFLKTLNDRHVNNGFAEMVKHALIANKDIFLDYLTLDNASINWSVHIKNSLEIKSKVVAEDPLEEGVRKALNFGHTIGHALESYYIGSDHPILHGEAVAAGMLCEAYLSHNHAKLSSEEFVQIRDYLISIYGIIPLDLASVNDVVELMSHDKKNEKGALLFTLIDAIGLPKINQELTPDDVKTSLNYYCDLA